MRKDTKYDPYEYAKRVGEVNPESSCPYTIPRGQANVVAINYISGCFAKSKFHQLNNYSCMTLLLLDNQFQTFLSRSRSPRAHVFL